MRFARASTAIAAAASGLALLAPVAAAQMPAVELPAVPDVTAQVPAIPAAAPQSAIPQQYHAIAKAVEKALPPVPAAPAPVATPAPAAPKAPEYHAAPSQYHSEPPADVTVTQTQPQNVNVSIRINSPGDDGPVVQVNGAGSDVETTIVQAPPKPPAPAEPAPADPTAPPAGALPEDWTWIWTSACFGGGASPPASLASADAGSGWQWQWSCEQPTHGIPMPDGFPGLTPAAMPAVAPASGAPPPPRPHPRPDRAHHARAAAVPAAAAAALAAAPRVLAAAQPAAAVAAGVPAVASRAVKAEARRFRDRVRSNSFLPGDGGQSAGAATGPGAAMSLLLGTWIVTLVLALSLVIPRIWLRRWSGPPWRWPFAPSTRLERPG